MRSNSIGNIGATSLITPLSKLSNLTSLVISMEENPIGSEGAKALLIPLASHTNITNLTLNLNRM